MKSPGNGPDSSANDAAASESPGRAPLIHEPLRPGLLLADRFRLVRHLGRGGLGHVWLARDVQLDDDEVACKILREDFFYDRRAIADMKREVLLTRRLRNRHILAVYTFWETPKHRFITMEYVEGRSLSEALIENRGPFHVETILPWLEQVCNALDYAHAEQVLHRDIKPANILVGRDGVVRLADFGIARTAQQVHTRFTGEMTSGTLLYMSPEQLLGERIDARSDLYGLAASIYELLTGAPPFYQGALITQIQMKLPAPIAHIGKGLNDILLRALSKSPTQRQSSCGEFYREFAGEASRWCEEHPEATVPATSVAHASPTAAWNPDADTVQMHIARTERQKPRIGMLLVQAGIVTEEQLEDALRVQEQTEEKLGTVLVELGYMAEDALADAVGAQLQVPFVRLEKEALDPDIARRINVRTLRSRRCIPVRREKDVLLLAMADPLDLAALNEIERLLKERVDIRIAPEQAIFDAIDRVFGLEETTHG